MLVAHMLLFIEPDSQLFLFHGFHYQRNLLAVLFLRRALQQ